MDDKRKIEKIVSPVSLDVATEIAEAKRLKGKLAEVHETVAP